MAAPRVTIDQLPEQATATGTDLLVVQNGPTTKKMTVSRILDVPATGLSDHLADAAAAHAATAISATPNTDPMIGTDVQAQLSQAAGAIASHLSDTTDSHDASSISVAAIASVVGTDVQAVLAELVARIVVLETP